MVPSLLRNTPKATTTKPTTAQDELQRGDTLPPIVMNNVPVNSPEIHEPGDQPSNAVQELHHAAARAITALEQGRLPTKEEVPELNKVATQGNNLDTIEKSDSEAETVVLDGKHDASGESTGKAIKNEHDSDVDGSQSSKINGFHNFSESKKKSDNGSDRPSLKRKRPSQEAVSEEHAPSSNLSSTVSSPAHQAHSSHAGESGSDNTRSTPPLDEGYHHQHTKPQKRRSTPDRHDHDRQKRGKSDPNSVAVHRKERRETRSATHHELPRHRSESPPSQRHKRAQSAQPIDLPDKHKRKRAPPPLLVERRRKVSEDTHGDSDDSSSVHSHPHLQKVASVDQTAISPAKVSMKKNRDRNGRTLLARACALDFNDAKRWLKERPQDIDVPDNAGNTPLQIASLEGFADVVQLLLEAGCDTSCKNIDMETPLIDAVENGHLEVVQLLLKAGLDPHQSNAKGEEPLDLVNPDNDNYDAIRAALIAAKEKNNARRPSEDHNAQHRDNDVSLVGASAASPTDGQTGKSPPPLSLGARRRTARSQQTQDSLLWVNPTPAKLRDACGRGDLSVVDYILRMRPEVGTDAVIAAARGGHDVVLEILFAIGRLDHDPDPVESDDFKPGRNTPMLAAIGRGHIPVIRLLVSQRGFNPTRCMFKGLTYHDLAKERQGSNWEEEYSILKQAYNDYKIYGGRRSNHSSPRKVRTKRPTLEAPVSPSSAKRQLSLSSVKTAPEPEIKREHSVKAPPNKHLQITEEAKDSAILSDRESESGSHLASKPKVSRSVSDAGAILSKHSDASKPRRKLLSRNDLKSGQEIKRRASLAPESSSNELPRRQPGDLDKARLQKAKRQTSESSSSMPTISKESNNHIHSSKLDLSKKRPRLSTSPQPSGAPIEKSIDIPEKKKKRKVDAQGNAVVQDPHRGDTLIRTGPASVANMIASNEQVTSPSEPLNRAPVANMGVSSTSPINKSPTESIPHQETPSPMSGIEHTLQQKTLPPKPPEHIESTASPTDIHGQDLRSPAEVDKVAEDERAIELEREKESWAAREEEERIARVARSEEKARLEQQRRAEEAERLAMKEHEEEEARIAKRRREEELGRKRAEAERLRREDQERRRAENEERERQRRMRQQEEEQQQLRDALPNNLRRAAELSPEKARQPQEAKRWLPLYTVTTRELDPGCNENLADERWIANIQAAPILAIKDLDLSQCKCPPFRLIDPPDADPSPQTQPGLVSL